AATSRGNRDFDQASTFWVGQRNEFAARATHDKAVSAGADEAVEMGRRRVFIEPSIGVEHRQCGGKDSLPVEPFGHGATCICNLSERRWAPDGVASYRSHVYHPPSRAIITPLPRDVQP